MTNPTLTRRSLIASTAALPLATIGLPAQAGAPMLGAATPGFKRITLGNFEVTTLVSNSFPREDPHSIFGLNVSEEEFNEVSQAANLPTDKATFFFTPTVVNTGSELVLFDTGLSAADITGALAAAGYSADQIDVVVITHMHGDHIGGLMNDGAPTFANARYVTGAVEFDAWSKADNENFDNNMKPLAEKTTMIDPGTDVVSGITAEEAFGHTPGHMTYRVDSDGKQFLIAADFANHYVWSLAHPDWEVKFDMDKAAAAATRKRLLDMMAADKIPFVGYHMPAPGIGYVAKHGDGYAYVPESYQLQL
ncbi:MBL fold metallo-hydrolase [Roseovarius sp. CAU 1744]|uniref:MBL fold metallo-hydrolase n=1 Tax=Roseovarius sp. CAU 1744 TaxID=3140368 RepID=UPI00325B28C0